MAMAADMGEGRRTRVPWRPLGWSLVGAALLAPLAAMQVSEEVEWTLSDFVFAGLLLGSLGLGLELASRRSRSLAYRAGAGFALATGVALLWLDAAVGLIGGDYENANALYLAVPAVALAGAMVARFRAKGMAWAMGAAALAQALVPFAAWVLLPALRPRILSPEVPVLTCAFVALWLVAARLFRSAA
jgi:hypothetical protein